MDLYLCQNIIRISELALMISNKYMFVANNVF